ncbi:uncharacterized protein Dmoj_GI26109 [Drosophila mojavensis]|uniref:HAT C-terminal dimerisation domain-containing protein n=1 Tax=Drosophila mojavensis TaxID=7230 RepID=A0A0Q9XSJ4_DROMO|nr:uncharacterized protein Dmoj_GI26109 [Drosophila mojavensis]
MKSLHFFNPATILNNSLKAKLPSIAHLGQMFPGLCSQDMTELDREWRLLRNMKFPFKEEEAVPPEDFWRYVSNVKNGNSTQTELTQNLLVLPHSSANVERLFSEINLIKTNNRNKLDTETLKGLLHTKIRRSPYFSKVVLRKNT